MTQGLVIPSAGAAPQLQPVAGDGPLELVAAELLPLDLQVARGALPSVKVVNLRAGQVAVARTADGSMVSVQAGRVGTGLGALSGTFAERFTAPDSVVAALPAGLDPLIAAAGTSAAIAARLALSAAECTPQDTVLVVGAGGAVGSAAVAIARASGCVVREMRRGETLRGSAPSVVIDCVGGPTLVEVIRESAARARHVLVGYAGDGNASLPLPLLLVREHRLLGFNVYLAEQSVFVAAHQRALEDLASGVVVVPASRLATVPLAGAAAAYAEGRRVLLTP